MRRRCACKFSEINARMLRRLSLFQCILVPELAQHTAKQAKAYSKDYSGYKKCHYI